MSAMEAEAGQRDDWMVLVDPHWQSAGCPQAPPPEAIIGGWLLDKEGNPGLFQPNPQYVPADDKPSDPVDAVMRLVARGADIGSEIIFAVRDGVVEIGCDADDQPLIGCAPDGAACVVVVTAAVHKRGIDVEHWNPIPGAQLPQIVPEGVDIMLNPGSPVALQLCTEALIQE